MEPLNQSITENIFICVIALLSFSIISFFISKTVTRPIEELNLAAKELAKGNWDYRINIKRSDEIGELSESFQTMASQLRSSMSNLENLVEIRTRDLKESNQSLEREIKERIKTEEALLEAKRAAEEANRAKSDFIATLSHEIRTPMNGVIGLSSLLLESNLTEEQKENVGTIITSGNALLGIINQVLELSKIEAGVLETAKEPFNLEELCKQIVELLKAQAKRKGIYIEMTYSDSIPHCFIGDEGKIRQALMNLVGNALKFTEKGGITIAISAAKDKENLYRVKIAVKDTGYGIAQDKQALLFRRFSRIIDKPTSESGGTGLGLSISKRLIELMGGDIGMSSQLGEGSTFCFELSLQDCTEKCTSINNPSLLQYEGRFDGIKVLIVEDNPINQRVAVGMLKKFGCQSTVAFNGIEAVQMIQENQYDLIFMDCIMPEMDGFEATERIRQIVKGRLPIIALTANATEEDKQRCLSAGMDGFITKPIRVKDVYEILDRWT